MKLPLTIACTALLVSRMALATVVQPLVSAPRVLIPAAGSTAGVNGTYFKSDISIVNLASHEQVILLQWLPQAGSGFPTRRTIRVPAHAGIRSDDFVHMELGQTGLGSILVSGVTPTGEQDSTAALWVGARIWTQQAGTNGTTSQSFPVIAANTISTAAARLFALGVLGDSEGFRVNVGIVNLDPDNAQTFVVQIPSIALPTSRTVTIPPMSMQQIPIGSGGSTLGAITVISIENLTAAATRSNLWTAYGSTIDNTTGDAWSELAVATPATGDRLSTGHWAGGGACLDVSTTDVTLAGACSAGQFPAPAVASDGHFEADGTFKTIAGPVTPGNGEPAHYSGLVQGDSLTLTIRTASATMGPFTLQFGSTVPCPLLCVSQTEGRVH